MKLKLACIAFILLMAQSVFALSLDEAKSRGFLGETQSGYLGAVDPMTSQGVLALMREINNRRRKAYEAIAKKNGTPVETVEALAGKKAIEQTTAGNYIKLNQDWVKK